MDRAHDGPAPAPGTERVLLHRVLTLPPEPASASRARRAVVEVLTGSGLGEDAVDSAALLVSELVTNAVLHARSEVGVHVTVLGAAALVEVSDRSPRPPDRRGYDATATTGRGLELLAALADDSGTRRQGHGKAVWFALGARREHFAAVDPARQPGWRASARPAREVRVRLLALPVALYRAWQQHADAVLRERLLDAYEGTGPGDDQLERLGSAGDALALLARATAPAFADDAPAALDAEVDVPAGAVARFHVLHDVLEESAHLAAEGCLLVLRPPPEIVAVRRWCCEEVVRQGAGLDPRPWSPAAAEEHAEPRWHPPDWDPAPVAGSAAALVAADDASRILAVSPAAAALLGWPAAELAGRRIVTIVPPALREAHVAGFVHHQVTGRSRILGTPVPVVALRRDGSTVAVVLRIEAHPAPAGRTVYVAEFTAPADGGGVSGAGGPSPRA